MAPIHFLPILFLTFPVLVFLIDGSVAPGRRGLRHLRPAAAIGWWFGFGYFLAGLYWIGDAFLAEGNAALLPLMPLAVIALPAGLALFPMLGVLAARMIWPDGPTRILALALGLGSSEWLRGHIFTGFPWNLFGQAVTFTDVTAQAAAVAGVYGLTFAVIAVCAAPALMGDEDRGQILLRRFLLTLAVLAVGADVSFGLYRLSHAAPTGKSTIENIRVRIVQPNIDQSQKWSPEFRQGTLDKLIALSDSRTDPETLGAVSFRQIIWPETALPFFLTEEPEALGRIAELLQPGTVLVTGAPRIDRSEDGRHFYNSVYLIDDRGNILDAYDKIHLVPFGEYLPLESLAKRLGLSDLFKGIGGFSAGPTRNLIAPPGLPSFVAVICYEAIFSGEVLDASMSKRPDYLLNVTNDGWFGNTAGPYQHLDQVRLRAIEEGLPVLRAANTGISAIIDAYGRIVAQIPTGTEGVLDGLVPSEHPDSPFTRRPLAFQLSFVAFSIILLVLGRRKRMKGS